MADISKIRLSGTTYDIVDESAVHSLSAYSTTQEVNNAITAATTALAESIEEQGYQNASQVNDAVTAATTPINNTLTAHTADTTIHVTAADKSNWNGKVNPADIAGLFGAVEYDSNTKHINFKHDATGTTLAYVDATDFIKDGMVDTVEIDTPSGGTYSGQTCLIITFNTDAGKEEIDIPISDIFDADNYYTVDEIDEMTSDIYDEIDTKEEVIASALTELNDTKQDALQYYEENTEDGYADIYVRNDDGEGNVDEYSFNLGSGSVDLAHYNQYDDGQGNSGYTSTQIQLVNPEINLISESEENGETESNNFKITPTGVTINDDAVVTESQLADYQPLLTAGTGITIDQNNVISSTGGGSNISVSGDVLIIS